MWLDEPGDMNQLTAFETTPFPNWLMYDVYQALVTVNISQEYQSGTITYLPMLAQNWTVSSNDSIYTFNLRQDVHFSDGNPLKAYDIWMMMYICYYLSDNTSAWVDSYDLFNMTNVNFGNSTMSMINSTGGLINPSPQAIALMSNQSWPIYVTGPYTIVFHLQAPFDWFLGLMIDCVANVYDAQYVMDNGGPGTPTQYNTAFDLNPIPGSGPYIVTGALENSYVKFAQDPNYWGLNLTASELAAQPLFDPGHAKNVIVYYKPDDLTRYTDLSTGAAQISAINPEDWNLVTTNPDYTYFHGSNYSGQVMFMSLNTQMYPTNNTDFRQAIVHAINYSAINQQAWLGGLKSYVGPEYPAWSQYYDLPGLAPYQYNLTLAEQYLNESGINVNSLPTLSMDIITSCGVCSTQAQIVQADLAEIGINVQINVMTEGSYFGLYFAGPYSVEAQNPTALGQLSFITGGVTWGPTGLTPADYFEAFVSCDSLVGNQALYCNPTVQTAVNAFTSSNNVTYIQSVVSKAEQQIYNDAPYAWIGVNTYWEGTGGSLVWKTGTITGFLTDPVWGTGQDDLPFFNTITFG